MASLNPLLRAFSVYTIYDEGRDCFLGKDGDHWMIISRQQYQDLLLFDTPQDAWSEIQHQPGLRVCELVIDITPGLFARPPADMIVPGARTAGIAPSSSTRTPIQTV